MKKLTIISMGAAIALVASTAPAMACGNTSAHISQASWMVRPVAEDLAFDQLPPQVQSTIKSQAPDDQIHKIKAETRKGQTVYRVEFARAPGRHLHPELLINADGSILKEKHMANVANEAAGAEK